MKKATGLDHVIAITIAVAIAGGLWQTTAAYSQNTKSEPQIPGAANIDAASLSAGFWDDWKKTKDSNEFKTLAAAQECSCKVPGKDDANADKAPARKSVVNIAITKPDDAAVLLGGSLAASDDPVQKAALATVVRMRIPEQVQKEAVELVPAGQRQRVETFRANLTTGIPGLPGIYLGDNSAYYTNAETPSGFVPVSGGSFGCPPRN